MEHCQGTLNWGHRVTQASDTEGQAASSAIPRDGDPGERSTLREEYSSASDKLSLRCVGEDSVETSSRQRRVLMGSRKNQSGPNAPRYRWRRPPGQMPGTEMQRGPGQ